MGESVFGLPQPPSLEEVAAELAFMGRMTREQLVACFLELEYQRDADYVVDRLIAQAMR